MPTDLNLSREEIERFDDEYQHTGWVSLADAVRLLQHALSEPTRLASARQEGHDHLVAALDRYWQFSTHDGLPASPTSTDINAAMVARCEAARQEGYREGVEAAAQAVTDRFRYEDGPFGRWAQEASVAIRALLEGGADVS